MKKNLVILTGAGISAESGLRTFRDGDGLWEQHRVEDVATPEAWQKDKSLVLRFYNERRKNVIAAKPNAAHIGLAALEKDFDVQIITQNIDDLHERAGSTQVMHLHGEILTMRSEYNEFEIYPIAGDINLGNKAPDGGQLRPNIVWFGEAVPMIEKAIPIMEKADVFVLIGSSLAVYPAAGLLHYLPNYVPKFVLDKQVPKMHNANLTAIEGNATDGITILSNYLAKLK